MKAAITQLVTQELAAVLKQSLDDILHQSYYNDQRGVRLVLYTIGQQVMLDLMRKEIIGEDLDAHISKFFNTDAAAGRLLKNLPTSNSFIAPVATVVR